jgi:hypothetical protein
MPRRFGSFDERVTDKEFTTLSDRDQAKLAAILEHYEHAGEDGIRPALVKDYGGGVLMIRHEKARFISLTNQMLC